MEIAVVVYFVIGFFHSMRKTFNPILLNRPEWALIGTAGQKFLGFLALMILWPLSMLRS
jgi:hypothetical protein